MKYLLTSLIFLALALHSYAQDSVLKTITQETCDCLESKKSQLLKENNTQKLYMAMGVCVFESYGNHKDAYDREFGVLNLNDGEAARGLGEKIGLEMAVLCPETLMLVAGQAEETKQKETFKTLEGIVVDIEKDLFNIVVVQEQNGKRHRLVWLDFFEGDDLIQNFSEGTAKDLTIEYEEKEFFDPNSKEYRVFKVVSKVTE